MSEKKELNQEQLEKVSGGDPDYGDIFGEYGFSGYVDMYALEPYIGKELWFVTKQTSYISYFKARLNYTGEDWNWFKTDRNHDVTVTDQGTSIFYKGNRITNLCGDVWSAYTNKKNIG